MKKWIILISILVLIIIVAIIKLIWKPEVNLIPKISLEGNKIVTLSLGERYKEDGFKATDSNGDNLTSEVKVTNDINYEKVGSYEILYQVKGQDGVMAEARRYIKITEKPYYKDSYDDIDNTVRGWWSGNKKDHTRPAGGADINELKKYNAYFMGKNKKVIYLTFDEGSNDTYVAEIVDVLNKNDVKATFFLCGNFILDHKELIKKMADSGHSVGNHTDNHYSMPTLATRENFDEYIKEIKTVEENYYNITGKNMDKIYRDPRGEWSYRDLQIMKDLGYKSFFYSADYLDFNGDVSKEYALNEMMKRYHNGAIYLLHPKNKGNYEALDSFIKEMKKQGFSFDLVKNI